mgnify:CR=1 FL=1
MPIVSTCWGILAPGFYIAIATSTVLAIIVATDTLWGTALLLIASMVAAPLPFVPQASSPMHLLRWMRGRESWSLHLQKSAFFMLIYPALTMCWLLSLGWHLLFLFLLTEQQADDETYAVSKLYVSSIGGVYLTLLLSSCGPSVRPLNPSPSAGMDYRGRIYAAFWFLPVGIVVMMDDMSYRASFLFVLSMSCLWTASHALWAALIRTPVLTEGKKPMA